MLLSEVLEGVEVIDHVGPLDIPIIGVTHDSRGVSPGALFCCVPGVTSDGHDHAADAVRRGAVALICERTVETDPAVSEVVVADARAVMARVAGSYWGWPSRAMRTVGVTGTAGKTTTVSFVSAILAANGWPCASVGTLTGARTTPEATELQATLATHLGRGAQALAMELSSIAIAQRRVDGMRFDVAVFTNLGHDHLDFHHDQETYFAAKAELFTAERAYAAVVCVDDEWGRRLAAEIEGRGDIPVTRASVNDASEVSFGPEGAKFRWRGETMSVPLAGVHNVTNAVLAATAAATLGVGTGAVARGLQGVEGVRGHFELVRAGQPFMTIVDFAHTPDALAAALHAARGLAEPAGRVIVVIGCGGDRDRLKRPLMAAAAEQLADVAILTSDNPRSEEPLEILAEMVGGLRDKASAVIESDRRRAIETAIDEARAGDVVLIAGKGHETTQTIGERVEPFDDRLVAVESLRGRGFNP